MDDAYDHSVSFVWKDTATFGEASTDPHCTPCCFLASPKTLLFSNAVIVQSVWRQVHTSSESHDGWLSKFPALSTLSYVAVYPAHRHRAETRECLLEQSEPWHNGRTRVRPHPSQRYTPPTFWCCLGDNSEIALTRCIYKLLCSGGNTVSMRTMLRSWTVTASRVVYNDTLTWFVVLQRNHSSPSTLTRLLFIAVCVQVSKLIFMSSAWSWYTQTKIRRLSDWVVYPGCAICCCHKLKVCLQSGLFATSYTGTRVTAKTNQTAKTHKSTKSTTSKISAYTGASSRTTATAVSVHIQNSIDCITKMVHLHMSMCHRRMRTVESYARCTTHYAACMAGN